MKTSYTRPAYMSLLNQYIKQHVQSLDFGNKLNQTPKKYVFMNGIYDIENLTFKEGIEPNDFIERTLPYNYYKRKGVY